MENALSSLLTGGGVTFGTSTIDLPSSSYLLGTIVFDVSGSTASYIDPMKNMIKLMLNGLKAYGTAPNIMIRLVMFGSTIEEIIPFTPLDRLNVDDVDKIYTHGLTALYDASIEALDATVTYGTHLSNQGYDIASNIYILTDGANCHGTSDIKAYREAKDKLATYLSEASTFQDFLIGLGTGQVLDDFNTESKFTSYSTLGDPSSDPGVLLKAGGFISQSLKLRSNRLQPGSSTVPSINAAPSLSII